MKNAQGALTLLNPPGTGPDPSIANLLKNKMAPNGTITLKGCKTGVLSDPNNVARALSKALPGTPVTGQNQNVPYIPFTDVTVPIPGHNTTTTYINGKAQ